MGTNKLIYIAIGVVLIVLVALSGSKAYTYIKQQEKALKTQILDLEKDKEYLELQLDELDVQEKNYYDEYVQEYRKRIKAEKALNSIKYLTFDRKYLDSLAKYIKY